MCNNESNQPTALVLGAGGFIGSHMVKRLVEEGYWVRGIDIKEPEFEESMAHDFVIHDIRQFDELKEYMLCGNTTFDEIYQFAANMGGAGFVFSGENDADIMHNSCLINLNVLDTQVKLNNSLNLNKTTIFYSSSACMYPSHNQLNPDDPDCKEESAYPADPDSEYGWEKLFGERLYLAYNRNYNLPVRIARYHNIFGPNGTYDGGREKAPAAMCRKVAKLIIDNPTEKNIEVWGDGKQTRSFLYITECIEATRRLMKSDFLGPVNIGSEEMVTIESLLDSVVDIANKHLQNETLKVNKIYKLDAPTGVRGRNSNNDLIREKLGWDYSMPLKDGLLYTYKFIFNDIMKNNIED